MADKALPGYQTVMGNKGVHCLDHNGPASYPAPGVPNNGERVTAAQFGLRCIDSIDASVGQDGLHQVVGQPEGLGQNVTWRLRWIVISTGLEVANAVDLSLKSVRLFIVGG